MSENKNVPLSRHDARKGKKLKWFRWGKRVFALAAIVFILFRFVIGISVVDGRSMMDTLQNGDIVVYSRLTSSLRKGDIVSVARPEGTFYVKRIVALGGDEVDLRDGVLYVNGVAETGSYVRGRTLAEEGGFTYPYLVKNGDAFVIGDNREESIDSRAFGAVNIAQQVKGILILQIGKSAGICGLR